MGDLRTSFVGRSIWLQRCSESLQCVLLRSARAGRVASSLVLLASMTIAIHALEPDAAVAVSGRSCGTVTTQSSVKYRLKITKGSPSCKSVRQIAKRYGHPKSKHPRFYCGKEAYECEYSIYPRGWRCGGLFQGSFLCWHGANNPRRAGQEFAGTNVYPRPRQGSWSGGRAWV